MVGPLTEESSGIQSLHSHGVPRSTGACGDWRAGPFSLAWLEARKELVGHADGTFRRGLLLLETQLHAAVLTSCFKFRTHKCNICCGMRPSAHGMDVITSHLLAFQWERIKEVSEKVQDKSWLYTDCLMFWCQA